MPKTLLTDNFVATAAAYYRDWLEANPQPPHSSGEGDATVEWANWSDDLTELLTFGDLLVAPLSTTQVSELLNEHLAWWTEPMNFASEDETLSVKDIVQCLLVNHVYDRLLELVFTPLGIEPHVDWRD